MRTDNIERGTIRQLRETEMDLFREFTRICEELGLSYFAVQGTLLGAIRHGGFIPWDDDIDVGMLRKDYEVFLREAPSRLPEYYFLQTFRSDPEFYHCFGKLRDSRTTFIESTAQKFEKMNQGIFIDIFPFDYYPESGFEARVFEARKFLLRYRLRSMFYIPQDRKITPANAARKALMAAAKVFCPSERKALTESEKLFKSVRPGRFLVNNGSPWGTREIVERKWMVRTEEGAFEDMFIRVPAGYDAYLRRVYGDYMQLPPEDERVPHHYARVIDPGTPYPQWMASLKSEE